LGRQIENVRFTVYNLLVLGLVHREMEDYHGARQVDREAVQLARTVGGAWLHLALAWSSSDAIALGRVDEAAVLVREAATIVAASQTQVEGEEVAVQEGHVLLAQGRPRDAQAVAPRLLSMVDANGTRLWQPAGLMLLAASSEAIGDVQTARAAYVDAAAEAERTGALPTQWRALAGLADLEHATGGVVAAAATARRAREIVDRLAAAIPDERLQATFLQSHAVQRISTLTA